MNGTPEGIASGKKVAPLQMGVFITLTLPTVLSLCCCKSLTSGCCMTRVWVVLMQYVTCTT